MKYFHEEHKAALEYIFSKAVYKAKEACEAHRMDMVDAYLDIAKDADHILRKHASHSADNEHSP